MTTPNVVSTDALRALAAQAPIPTKSPTTLQPKPEGEQTDRERKADEAYFNKALTDELSELAGTSTGDRNNAVNRCAFAIGQLLHYEPLREWEVRSAIERAGRETGLPMSEVKSALESGLEDGKQEPRYRPQNVSTFTHATTRTVSRPESVEHTILSTTSESMTNTREWPTAPQGAAYAGIVGDLVRLTRVHTEADDIAVAINFMSAFGNAIGRGPFCAVGATTHGARIFPVLVGNSSKGRKGESWSPARALFEIADSTWSRNCVHGGLSSGEGLIHAVRDEVKKLVKKNSKDGTPTFEESTVDEGVEDKRLFVQEPEFARVLQSMSRQGNILSAVIRDAWDRGNLQSMTRGFPAKATGAHITITGHITATELKREMTTNDAANGFGNRLLWVAVRRAREIPRPAPFEGDAVEGLATRLTKLLGWATSQGRITFDEAAGELWDTNYSHLSREREGLVGSLLARSEAQVLRLSLLYALLDHSAVIQQSHLLSALDMWGYCERSVEYVFGADAVANPIAQIIYEALKKEPLSKSAINALFNNNLPTKQVEAALDELFAQGKVDREKEQTGGRPVEVWTAIKQSI